MVYIRERAKPRWNVDEVEGFCGWDFLFRMYHLADREWLKRLVVVAFLTGGRIREVLKLRAEHFDFRTDPEFVVVRAMPVGKRYVKLGLVRKWKCDGHCRRRWNREPTVEERIQHNIIESVSYTHLTLPTKRIV